MKKSKSEHKEYRVISFRMHDKTIERMKQKRGRQTWNRYFLQQLEDQEKREAEIAANHSKVSLQKGEKDL